MQTLLHMGQAPIDTVMLRRSDLKGCHASALRSKTRRKNKRFSVDLPLWLVDLLKASSFGHKDYFFWDGKVKPDSAVRGWYERLQPIFAAAKASKDWSGVDEEGRPFDMHPYLFRHYFISSQIADSFFSDEVAAMAGNSVAEIERTYAHKLAKGLKRVKAKQVGIWLSQGLDENGNELVQ